MKSKELKTNNEKSFLSQIFFPANTLLNIKSHAFLVGWNLENFQCCISCIFELPVESFDQLQKSIASTNELNNIYYSCSRNGKSKPVILGEWIPHVNSNYVPPISFQSSGIWIILTKDNKNNIISNNIISNYNNNNNNNNNNNDNNIRNSIFSTNILSSIGISTDTPPIIKPKLFAIYSLGCAYKTSCYLTEYSTINTDDHCGLITDITKGDNNNNGSSIKSNKEYIPNDKSSSIISSIQFKSDVLSGNNNNN
jgi:hypothetical protein